MGRINSLLAMATVVLLVGMVAQASETKFWSSSFIRTEYDSSSGAQLRTMPQNGTFYYDGSGSTERWRLLIPFNGFLLEEIRLWESMFLRYTKCDGKCGFEDKFTETSDFPIMYHTAFNPVTSDVNGFPAASLGNYPFDIPNGDSITESIIVTDIGGGVKIPVRVRVRNPSLGTAYQMDFFAVSNSAFTIDDAPAGCTAVDPGCFRLDIYFGLDYSGSVGGQVTIAKDFVRDFGQEVIMAPDRVRIGAGKYARTPTPICSLKSSFNDLVTCLDGDTQTSGSGATGTAHVMALGAYEMLLRGRLSARKVMVVVTDGVANYPYYGYYYDWIVTDESNPPAPDYCQNNCNGVTCDQSYSTCSMLNIQYLWAVTFPSLNMLKSMTVYAVGVGGGIDSERLYLTAQNKTSNVFQVATYAGLNEVIDSLVSALACEVPPTALCPNDCLPGGFCCGQSCECLVDCKTLDNSCQQASCQVTTSSTQCVLTAPEDGFCVTNDPCNVGKCIDTVGCTTVLTNATCDDQNPCTANDRCTLGGCYGEPQVNASCPVTEVCKIGLCDSSGICNTYDKECIDPNPDDCETYYCDDRTNACATVTQPNGEKCKADDPSTPCTVYVCEGSSCVGKTRDSSECQDSAPTPVGAIAGGVAGGVSVVAIALLLLLGVLAALLALCLIVGLIAVLIICAALLATAGVGVQTTALAAAVEGGMDVQVNPGHVEAATEAVSPLFEG